MRRCTTKRAVTLALALMTLSPAPSAQAFFGDFGFGIPGVHEAQTLDYSGRSHQHVSIGAAVPMGRRASVGGAAGFGGVRWEPTGGFVGPETVFRLPYLFIQPQATMDWVNGKATVGLFAAQHLEDVISFEIGGSGPRLNRYGLGLHLALAYKIRLREHDHLALGFAINDWRTDLLEEGDFPTFVDTELRMTAFRLTLGYEFDRDDLVLPRRGRGAAD